MAKARGIGIPQEGEDRFDNIEPPPPAAGAPPLPTAEDQAFVDSHRGGEAAPQPQAPSIQPPPMPQEPQQQAAPQEEEEGPGAAEGAAAGGSIGSVLGPVGTVAGTAIGAGVGFAASQSFKKSPIGSLEGGGEMGGGDQEVLRQLLEVQRGIARVGSLVKDAILTKPVGSRM